MIPYAGGTEWGLPLFLLQKDEMNYEKLKWLEASSRCKEEAVYKNYRDEAYEFSRQAKLALLLFMEGSHRRTNNNHK